MKIFFKNWLWLVCFAGFLEPCMNSQARSLEKRFEQADEVALIVLQATLPECLGSAAGLKSPIDKPECYSRMKVLKSYKGPLNEGTKLVIPTLLSWPHSVLVYDDQEGELGDHGRLAQAVQPRDS